MLNIAICDDEEIFRGIIREKCINFCEVHNIKYKLYEYMNGEEFADIMLQILADIEAENRYIVVESLLGVRKVNLINIEYIMAEKKYSRIFMDNGESIFSDKSIGSYLEELKIYGFGMCHRSYIVNYEQVKMIRTNIQLYSDRKVPVSRRMKNTFMKEYKEYFMTARS